MLARKPDKRLKTVSSVLQSYVKRYAKKPVCVQLARFLTDFFLTDFLP
jgi:hypothetical protein